MVAQEIKRREEEEDSVLVTPHEGGKDTTLVEVLQKAANKSNPSKDGRPLGRKIVRNFRNEYGIKGATAQARTAARDFAGKDVRNTISTCTAWLAIISLGVPARGILNFDAALDGFGQGPS